jgi:hypothetical protein
LGRWHREVLPQDATTQGEAAMNASQMRKEKEAMDKRLHKLIARELRAFHRKTDLLIDSVNVSVSTTTTNKGTYPSVCSVWVKVALLQEFRGPRQVR